MKKGLYVVMSVLLIGAILFTGCAPVAAEEAPAAEDASAEEAPVEKEDLVFASVVKSIAFNWFKRLEVGILDWGGENGVTTFMEGPSEADSAEILAQFYNPFKKELDAASEGMLSVKGVGWLI